MVTTQSALLNHKDVLHMPPSPRWTTRNATYVEKLDTCHTTALRKFGVTTAIERDMLRTTARTKEEHPALQTLQATVLDCHPHQGPTDT